MNVTSLASFGIVIAVSGDSIIFSSSVRNELTESLRVTAQSALHEMPREPIHRRATGFVRARTSIDGIVAALNLQQMLRLTGPRESCTDGVRRRNHIVLCKDHQERTRRDEFDRFPRGVL